MRRRPSMRSARKSAEDRRQIDAGGVGAEDRGGERLTLQTAIEPAEAVERRDVLNAPGQQEILDHVKDEQRLHPVVGKALPRLGEGEVPEPAWMAQEIGHVVFAGERRGIIGFSGGSHGWPD